MIAEPTAKPKTEFDRWNYSEFKPKQIMPADGWFAVYEVADGKLYERLSAWACGDVVITEMRRPAGSKQSAETINKYIDPHVWGIVAFPDEGLHSAEEARNWTGYIHESELPCNKQQLNA